MMIPANIIEIINGKIIIDLATDAANDDWIRSVRLLKKGEKKKLEKLEEQQMYIEVED